MINREEVEQIVRETRQRVAEEVGEYGLEDDTDSVLTDSPNHGSRKAPGTPRSIPRPTEQAKRGLSLFNAAASASQGQVGAAAAAVTACPHTNTYYDRDGLRCHCGEYL